MRHTSATVLDWANRGSTELTSFRKCRRCNSNRVPGGTPPVKKSRGSAGCLFPSVGPVKLVAPVAAFPVMTHRSPQLRGFSFWPSASFQSEVFRVKFLPSASFIPEPVPHQGGSHAKLYLPYVLYCCGRISAGDLWPPPIHIGLSQTSHRGCEIIEIRHKPLTIIQQDTPCKIGLSVICSHLHNDVCATPRRCTLWNPQ
jgi:hypothetical protein